LEGAGRSRRLLVGSLVLGMVLGTSALGAVLWGLHEIVSSSGYLTAGVLVALLVLEFSNRGHWLAANRRVPAGWVQDGGWRAGLVWGGALGSGLVTEAPYAVLHAALALAVLSPTVWGVVLVPAVFGAARLLVILVPKVRRAILDRTGTMVVVAGREIPASMLVARLCSRFTLLAVTIWMIGAVVGG
jgi:hypothetical protein